MKKIRLKQIENAVSDDIRETTPEEIEAYRAEAVEMILSVVERTPKDAPPVKESISDLLKELKNPKRPPVVLQTMAGERIVFNSDRS